MKTFLLSFFMFVTFQFSLSEFIFSQTENIVVREPYEITTLINKHISHNASMNGMEGFRIQIFYDSGNNSKSHAYAVKSGFILKYPNIRAYITYEAPNFKVRVGDFRSRLDAERFRNKIIDDYPSAFIMPDKISFPSLDIYDEI